MFLSFAIVRYDCADGFFHRDSTRIIHVVSFVQVLGVCTRRYSNLFQGFSNAANAQR
jgi:hypothetical protein